MANYTRTAEVIDLTRRLEDDIPNEDRLEIIAEIRGVLNSMESGLRGTSVRDVHEQRHKQELGLINENLHNLCLIVGEVKSLTAEIRAEKPPARCTFIRDVVREPGKQTTESTFFAPGQALPAKGPYTERIMFSPYEIASMLNSFVDRQTESNTQVEKLTDQLTTARNRLDHVARSLKVLLNDDEILYDEVPSLEQRLKTLAERIGSWAEFCEQWFKQKQRAREGDKTANMESE